MSVGVVPTAVLMFPEVRVGRVSFWLRPEDVAFEGYGKVERVGVNYRKGR